MSFYASYNIVITCNFSLVISTGFENEKCIYEDVYYLYDFKESETEPRVYLLQPFAEAELCTRSDCEFSTVCIVHATIRQRENLQKMEQKLRAEEERLMQQVDTQCLPSNLQEDEVLNSEKQVEQTKLSETERQVEQEKTLESDIKTRKKVEPQEKHKKCYPKKTRTLYFQKRIE